MTSLAGCCQVDLGTLRRVTRIATQGRQDAPQWVTSYKLAYSTTGATYSYVSDDDAGGERVFAANSDENTIVEHALGHVMLARFVRVYPQAWQQHMSLRWELYGCGPSKTCRVAEKLCSSSTIDKELPLY